MTVQTKFDIDAIRRVVDSEPILRKDYFGMLVAILINALEALNRNCSKWEIKYAQEFIDEENDLFVALANELDIDPAVLKNKILSNGHLHGASADALKKEEV